MSPPHVYVRAVVGTAANAFAISRAWISQAMLVAGSAVASLGGESLQTIDADNTGEHIIGTLFVAATAATLCWYRLCSQAFHMRITSPRL